MQQILIPKGKTVVVSISLGFDVSQDTFSSEIRVGKTPFSTLIAEWLITFDTDGTDGELLATLDETVTIGITQNIGYMDLKRVSGGPPLPVFDEPLEVLMTNEA